MILIYIIYVSAVLKYVGKSVWKKLVLRHLTYVLIAGIVYSIVVLESVLAGFGLGLEGSGLFQVFLF